ncbi:PI-PLC X domain-containing protein 2 [Scaptodrosophila lebanonensis]|uniref:PI-PLC X domain-containing protein 2 n=1 Tax=Drosophila lebanonensis TaxID=7225 RepID=A0A6J2TEK0_DROLE|nr:PI-PLC X domain-containing protein 2 [Scaptodrosophila lebanonensis]
MSREHWMSELPPQVRNMSIINLAIPGSHNSMTYGINSRSGIAPDADKSIRRWNRFFPCFVRRWAKTQSASILEQLHLGVRYFDLRIAQHEGKFYYVHGLLSMEVFEPLYELCQFLATHRQEVVVLDMQHFYDLNVVQHQQLHKELLYMFGERFYATTDGSLHECSLQRCEELQRQLVLIYRRCPISLPVQFWPSSSWPTPWPNKASVKKLKEFLENSLLSRQPSQGYVSQCLLTPTGRYIAFRVFSNLKRTAKRVDKELHSWISEQVPGPFDEKQPPRANVFLADFVGLKDGQFCNWIVALNNKLDTESICMT